jgi:hypothetical protein
LRIPKLSSSFADAKPFTIEKLESEKRSGLKSEALTSTTYHGNGTRAVKTGNFCGGTAVVVFLFESGLENGSR